MTLIVSLPLSLSLYLALSSFSPAWYLCDVQLRLGRSAARVCFEHLAPQRVNVCNHVAETENHGVIGRRRRWR